MKKKTTKRLVFFLLILFITPWILAMLFERRLIYFPEKYPGGLWKLQRMSSELGEIVPAIEDCWFITRDGISLHGWYCSPSKMGEEPSSDHHPARVLLFFHGNSGNITYRYDMIKMLTRIPVDVFIVDYRGYGRSQGKPSENGLYLDAQASWEYLTAQRGISQGRIIILGKSLGGAVAIDLATRVTAAGLIVQSSFTSIPDMAHSIVPFFPRFLVRTKMDSVGKIPGVACPKLFIHSPADEVVPYRFGRRLFEAAGEPKSFYEVPGAPHNETYLVGGEEYLAVLRRFIDSVTPHSP